MDPKKERITVLVVDNDKDFLAEVSESLDGSGYTAVAVNDPMIALMEIERVKPDVVLLDLQMPGKSGLEIGYEIRRRPQFARTPILALSGIFPGSDIPLPEVWGVKHCLNKPFHPSELICAIEKILAKQTALIN
jgi:CheY-like chemotaxis protein